MLLSHTLSIMNANTDDQLIDRTLAAACDATGATVAAGRATDGTLRTYGDEALADRLRRAVDALGPQPCGVSTAFAHVGLPRTLVAALGDIRVYLAFTEPRRLEADAEPVLGLLVAHAETARARLTELDQLNRRANRDPLTGLHHHRPFCERLAASSPGQTAVITLDVDRFKRINDELGHDAGDQALITLAESMRTTLRDADQLYRIGGDEFAVVVDVASAAEAVAIARRLLAAARGVGPTVSAGIALQLPGESGRQTLIRADGALYEAKRAGRDTARLAATNRVSGAVRPRPARRSGRC
jgi:diguanylate cyclase (GGDEF)-like protein